MPRQAPRPEQSSRRTLTAHAGLVLVGEAIKVSRLREGVKQSMGTYQGVDHADVLPVPGSVELGQERL
ncbi:hypothetical protein [Ectothiorhodospira lacustris]|uniref:hypothetical protein n=1 Tax=Ectothiorhodospira lacustris TaxID=2899127 RepID=UPI001EE9A9B4|nr:hypothetical protein [Ectothiorhodospira lacustris]MCG5510657.1 hypothetical protein [Ectothiorhodospira lacustris]MCG5522443.1 hypothetical protein [Ectothiorhodospira lacustris]